MTNAETAFEQLGTAILVQVNLAISGMERLVREVRAALQRRQREEPRARQAAVGRLHSELNGTVTALLLSSELALGTSGLPAAAGEKLRVGTRIGGETPEAIGECKTNGRASNGHQPLPPLHSWCNRDHWLVGVPPSPLVSLKSWI